MHLCALGYRSRGSGEDVATPRHRVLPSASDREEKRHEKATEERQTEKRKGVGEEKRKRLSSEKATEKCGT